MNNLKLELPNKITHLSRNAVKELQQLLNQNGYSLVVDGIIGEKSTRAFNDFKFKNYLEYPNIIGSTTLNFLIKNATPKKLILTLNKLKRIYIHTPEKKLIKFIKPLNKTCQKFKINNKPRMTAFLAQLGHESGGFKYMEELASGRMYENRRDLGNIYKGDGMRFKGRGCIQITGRYNYTKVSQYLKTDFINNPKLLAQLPYAILSAGWYWNSRGLNQYADNNNLIGFRKITRLINGGYNGLSDRLNYWSRAKLVI